MTKLLGCLLLIIAGAGLGAGRAAALRERCRELSELTAALGLLRDEICEYLTPMCEIAARLSRSGPERTRRLFAALSESMPEVGETGFARLWDAACADSGLCLRQEERAELSGLGLCLGRASAQEQGAAIGRCIGFFEASRELSSREAAEKRRLYPGLGAAVGAILAIALV